jgi:hypothetical protein
VIHIAMVPAHAGGGLLEPLGFAAVAWFQLTVAAVVLAGRAERRLYQLAALGNLAVLGLWAWSRTAGLPVGSHAGGAEAVTGVDAAAAALAMGVVLLAVRLLLAGERTSGHVSLRRSSRWRPSAWPPPSSPRPMLPVTVAETTTTGPAGTPP